jgi:hypothetical protein
MPAAAIPAACDLTFTRNTGILPVFAWGIRSRSQGAARMPAAAIPAACDLTFTRNTGILPPWSGCLATGCLAPSDGLR